MEKRNWVISGVVFLLLLVVAAWVLGWFGADPAIAKLQEIGEQMSEPNLPDAQRDQLRDQFRQQMQSLSEDQRRAFFNSNRDQWQARSQQRMDQFFAMPKTEQIKQLDQTIKRMSQPRTNQPGGGRGNAGGGGRGPGGGRGMTESQREERSKRRLDGSTPKMRAQYSEYRRMLDQRAQQLGVNLPNNGWRSGAT
jgi:hypothetical protein